MCCHVYVTVHIKEHMWSIRTSPTTILLSAMSECVGECCTERLNDKEILPHIRWQACVLPRELIWEEVAPPHNNGMTQYGKVACAGINVKCLRK